MKFNYTIQKCSGHNLKVVAETSLTLRAANEREAEVKLDKLIELEEGFVFFAHRED